MGSEEKAPLGGVRRPRFETAAPLDITLEPYIARIAELEDDLARATEQRDAAQAEQRRLEQTVSDVRRYARDLSSRGRTLVDGRD